jgi:hypothetical protein
MAEMNVSSGRLSLICGLVLGAAGIAVLWAAGVDFPVAVPPGLVLLLVGAALVATVRARWSAGVGGALGMFVLVGFLLSPTGLDNLSGDDGAAVAVGQAIEVLGVLVAAVSGALVVLRRS